MEDLDIIIFDENNIGHHIKPFDLTFSEKWSKVYTSPNLTVGIRPVLSKEDELQFVEFIIGSLNGIPVHKNEEILEKPPVINVFYRPVDCIGKIFVQSSLTIYHLNVCSTRDDWYEDMVDFIEYNGLTFGMPSTGYRQYLEAVQYLIERQDPDPKLAKLSKYIRMELSKENKESDKNHLPSLFEMFDEWWKSIPFDLEYLNPIKKGKNDMMALLFAIGPKRDGQINRYSDTVKTSAYSIPELSNALCNLTTATVRRLNVLTYYDDGLLTNPKALELQLLLANRRKQLADGYVGGNDNQSHEYEGIWKSWLEDEKTFFAELKDCLLNVIDDQEEMSANTKRIINKLNEYNFNEFLKKKDFQVNKIHSLMAQHAGKERTPYTIALLYVIGYLEHFYNELCKNKTEGHAKLSKVFEVPDRRIKGNVGIIMTSSSNEDPTQYTSINYVDIVKKELEGLN